MTRGWLMMSLAVGAGVCLAVFFAAIDGLAFAWIAPLALEDDDGLRVIVILSLLTTCAVAGQLFFLILAVANDIGGLYRRGAERVHAHIVAEKREEERRRNAAALP